MSRKVKRSHLPNTMDELMNPSGKVGAYSRVFGPYGYQPPQGNWYATTGRSEGDLAPDRFEKDDPTSDTMRNKLRSERYEAYTGGHGISDIPISRHSFVRQRDDVSRIYDTRRNERLRRQFQDISYPRLRPQEVDTRFRRELKPQPVSVPSRASTPGPSRRGPSQMWEGMESRRTYRSQSGIDERNRAVANQGITAKLQNIKRGSGRAPVFDPMMKPTVPGLPHIDTFTPIREEKEKSSYFPQQFEGFPTRQRPLWPLEEGTDKSLWLPNPKPSWGIPTPGTSREDRNAYFDTYGGYWPPEHDSWRRISELSERSSAPVFRTVPRTTPRPQENVRRITLRPSREYPKWRKPVKPDRVAPYSETGPPTSPMERKKRTRSGQPAHRPFARDNWGDDQLYTRHEGYFR